MVKFKRLIQKQIIKSCIVRKLFLLYVFNETRLCLSYDKFGRWDKDCEPKLQNKAKLASKNNEQIKSISQNIGFF